MKDIVIFGAGSVGRLALQILEDMDQDCREWNIVGFLDQAPETHGTAVGRFPV